MGIFDKLFGPSEVEKLKEKRDVQGLIGKINLGYRGCSDVCKALGQIGDERAVAPLIEVLEKSKDDDSRKTATTALGQIGDERAVMPLIKLLEDERTDGEVCTSIVVALGKIGGERVIEALVKAFPCSVNEIRGRKNPIGLMEVSVSMAISHVLGGIGKPVVEEAIIRALKSDNKDVARGAAATAIAFGIKDNRTIQPLIKAIDGKCLYGWDNAARALESIGKPAVELLTKALEDENEKDAHERIKQILEKIQKK